MGLGAEMSNDRIRSLRIGPIPLDGREGSSFGLEHESQEISDLGNGRRGRPMTEVLTPLPISTPSSLVIQARGQSSTEDKLSSHRRREASLNGETLDSSHAIS